MQLLAPRLPWPRVLDGAPMQEVGASTISGSMIRKSPATRRFRRLPTPRPSWSRGLDGSPMHEVGAACTRPRSDHEITGHPDFDIEGGSMHEVGLQI